VSGLAHPPGRPNPSAIDFDRTPFVAIWETTRACDLACRHCRAEAIPTGDPAELKTEEGFALLDELHAMGTPICVLSGGDPAKRPDLIELVRHGARTGMQMATIPAATPLLDRNLVVALKEAGLAQMALSLDGPDAASHDAFRGVPGAFARTLEGARYAREVGLPLQINTTFSAANRHQFAAMASLVKELGAIFWEVFFLVPMGRGSVLTGLSAAECERLFEVIYRVQKKEGFIVKVTEAPHYRRHVAQREMKDEGARSARPEGLAVMPARLTQSEGPGHTVGLAPRGVNSGNGFLFVSHLGEIMPSGFLPIPVGNVREMPLAAAYRESPLFLQLRAPSTYKGRCGRCEFRDICGGSRSRAYGLTGDPFETDPWCSYEPLGGAAPHPPDPPLAAPE
jgi:radical SAM protein